MRAGARAAALPRSQVARAGRACARSLLLLLRRRLGRGGRLLGRRRLLLRRLLCGRLGLRRLLLRGGRGLLLGRGLCGRRRRLACRLLPGAALGLGVFLKVLDDVGLLGWGNAKHTCTW